MPRRSRLVRRAVRRTPGASESQIARGAGEDLPETGRLPRGYGSRVVAALHRREEGDFARDTPHGELARHVIEPGSRVLSKRVEVILISVVPAKLAPEFAKGTHLRTYRNHRHQKPYVFPRIAVLARTVGAPETVGGPRAPRPQLPQERDG